jgi:DNA-binding IclR family transcriptional regulator
MMKIRVLKREPQGAQSIEVGFSLLDHLTRVDHPLQVAQIAEAAGFTTAKVQRYLNSFEQSGFVIRHAAGGYELGPSAVLVGLAAQHRIDEFRLVEDALVKLQQLTGATASAVVWGNHGPTIIRRIEPARAVTVTTRVGSVIPVTRASSGIVFAAFLPPELVNAKIAEELGMHTPTSRQKELARSRFAGKVEDARKYGIATVEGEFVKGVDAIASPVFGPGGEVWVSLAILGPHGSFDLSPHGFPKTTLLEVTRALSVRVGADLQS